MQSGQQAIRAPDAARLTGLYTEKPRCPFIVRVGGAIERISVWFWGEYR